MAAVFEQSQATENCEKLATSLHHNCAPSLGRFPSPRLGNLQSRERELQSWPLNAFRFSSACVAATLRGCQGLELRRRQRYRCQSHGSAPRILHPQRSLLDLPGSKVAPSRRDVCSSTSATTVSQCQHSHVGVRDCARKLPVLRPSLFIASYIGLTLLRSGFIRFHIFIWALPTVKADLTPVRAGSIMSQAEKWCHHECLLCKVCSHRTVHPVDGEAVMCGYL